MTFELAVFAVFATVTVAAVLVWVGLPLWRGDSPSFSLDPRAVALLARRAAVLGALRDLDADRADGRMGEADHDRLRTEALAEGAAVLAALDRLAERAADRTAVLVADIEREVAAMLGDAHAGTPARPGTDTPVCPACGRRHVPGDRFCANCGRAFGGAPVE